MKNTSKPNDPVVGKPDQGKSYYMHQTLKKQFEESCDSSPRAVVVGRPGTGRTFRSIQSDQSKEGVN